METAQYKKVDSKLLLHNSFTKTENRKGMNKLIFFPFVLFLIKICCNLCLQ